MTNEQYYELIGPYHDANEILLTRLSMLDKNLYDKDASCPIHNMQHRIKKKKSIEGKLVRRDLTDSLQNAKDHLMDIAGIRVICYFVEDIYNLAELVKKQMDLIVIKERDYISNPKPNGYRSYHMVVGVPVYYLDVMEYFPVEIQFRTLSMDFWASMEHRINYKKNRADKQEVAKELLECARSLEEIEERFKSSVV